MLREEFEKIGKVILKEIKKYYKDRLISVVIFGSLARGCPSYDSDIDLLIVAEKLPRGRMKRVREFEKVENKIDWYLRQLEKKGIYTYLSPIIKTKEEVELGSPLFLDMVENSIILFDRNDFFKNKILDLKKRLEKSGAKRIEKESYWYWVLNPDMEL